MSSETSATDGRQRFRALDGLRGVAALLVVLLHVEWPNHLTNNRFVQHGYIAVDLFFILSGLVISSNYLTRITTLGDAKKFLGLRLFRLYPLHLAVLVAFVGLECAKLAAQHAFALEHSLPSRETIRPERLQPTFSSLTDCTFWPRRAGMARVGVLAVNLLPILCSPLSC